MSLVTWNDDGTARAPVRLVLIFTLAPVAYLFGGLRLIASIWGPHSPALVAWWPSHGWAMVAPLLAFMILCLAAHVLKHAENPMPALFRLSTVLIALCLAAFVYESLCRTEVYRDGLVLRQPFEPARRYSLDQIVRLEVSCDLRSRGGVEPGLVARTTDGTEIDVGEPIGWNGPRRADWLAAAELVSAQARTRDLWRVQVTRDGQSNILTRCVRELAGRFPEQDRGRVVALFRP